MAKRITAIDVHAGGGALRLIRDGWPEPDGATMRDKLTYASARQDKLRRFLLREPRGHADLVGAVLTQPEHAGSSAGVLFMHNDGFAPFCGHGLLALARLLATDGPLRLDTAVGSVTLSARDEHVSFEGVPSFVFRGGVPVIVGGRPLMVDVAYGGAFYAFVDAEAAGLAVTSAKLPELRAKGDLIRETVEREIAIVHPTAPAAAGLDGVVFTGPASTDGAAVRSVTVFADRAIDRSPNGAATCALAAVLDAMGLADPAQPVVQESIVGATFAAHIVSRTTVGDWPAIVPELRGTAFLTGEHNFILEPRDPFPQGLPD